MGTPCRAFRRGIGAVATATLLVVSPAYAADVHVERASGAEECPDPASFGMRVHGSVADSAAKPTARVITVRFERTAKGYRSSVLTSDGMSRSLVDEASSCEALAEATLLAVRLTLDLAPPASEPAPTAAPVVVAEPLPAPAEAPPEAAAPTPRDEHRALGAEILASGALTAGIGSPFAPGFRGGAAATLGLGRWSVGITGVVLPSQTRDLGGGTVDIAVAGGGIEACGRAHVSPPIVVALCARAEALRLAGTAHGFAHSEEHARPLFTGTLLGRGQMRVAGPVAAFVEVGAVVPVIRERFAIDGVGIVYDPPFVAGSCGLGALVDFE